MPSITVYNMEGETVGSVDDNLETSVGPRVMHQTLIAAQAGRRQGTHQTKGRGELRGGGRKPYRQKGTGRARHGSRREPQCRGGGIVHGPQSHRHGQSVMRQVGRQALASALGGHLADDTLRLVEVGDSFDGKTQTLIQFLLRQELVEKKVLLLATSPEASLLRAGRNIEGMQAQGPGQTGVVDILKADAVVCTRGAWEELSRRRAG